MAVDTLARAIAAGKVPVDAYEMAVAGGYTGTKEEFETAMGNSGTNATAAADAAAEAAASAVTAGNVNQNLAAAYDSSSETGYAVDDYVLYNNVLYRCINAVAPGSAWNASDWEAVKLGEEMEDFGDELTAYKSEKADAIVCTTSGSPAVFTDGNARNAYAVVASIVPVQSGTGDPSPTNIRPITGWTGLTLTVSPTDDAQDGTTYSASWQSQAGTIYGGNYDLASGVLTKTYELIASYSGQTLPGAWISDRDVYSPGETPSTGAQVVYQLAEPVAYSLTPIPVLVLEGENHFSADTGSVSVTYAADTKLYIDKMLSEIVSQIVNS